jgi:hypothetical protein
LVASSSPRHVPGIHVFQYQRKNEDGRDKPGRDGHATRFRHPGRSAFRYRDYRVLNLSVRKPSTHAGQDTNVKRLGIFLAIVFAGVVVYVAVFSATVRYRLTIEAEVDGQRRTGSGVIEVNYSKNNDPISQAAFSIDIRGEAIALELGSRGTLFALLKGDTDSRSGPEYIVLRAFDFFGGAFPSPVMNGLRQVQRLSGKRELPLTSLPLLVRFRDINNPLTVERVDPLDLEKSFGPGVKLTRASLEIVSTGIWPFSWFGVTGEPISRGIYQKLKWLDSYYNMMLDGRFETIKSPSRFANSLTSGAFKAGR